MYIYIGISLYILIGIIRVGYDFIQPFYNQPRYIVERSWIRIILYALFWPAFMYLSSDYFYFWQYFKSMFVLKNPVDVETEIEHKEKQTGISKLSIIEKELKNKKSIGIN